jgi:signal recognition particle subunit SRP19
MPKNVKRIVWPVYMDAHKTRKKGRILAKKDSIGAPELKEIIRAAHELGLEPLAEEGKMYPRFWWEHGGRVLIDSSSKKREAVKQIAQRIRSFRAPRDV